MRQMVDGARLAHDSSCRDTHGKLSPLDSNVPGVDSIDSGPAEGVGSSGRIRTEGQPSTPAEPEQLELDLSGTWPRVLLDHFGPKRTEKRDS